MSDICASIQAAHKFASGRLYTGKAIKQKKKIIWQEITSSNIENIKILNKMVTLTRFLDALVNLRAVIDDHSLLAVFLLKKRALCISRLKNAL